MCLKNSRSCSVKLKKTHEFSMGKKRSWFSLLKRLFGSEPKSKAEKKSNRWRWIFGGLNRNQYPKIGAPQRILNEAREEQRKQAMAVAIATAAAAEAAVAAARAAAEVVHLTGVPQSYKDYEKRTRNLAATKIQAAYRAHLARKALKALKGLVRLQAMVRGRIVRRQVITKLKYLPLGAKAQSQVQQARVPTGNGSCKDGGKKQSLSPKEEFEEKKSKLRSNSRRNWDYSLFSREDMEALWLRKQEATLKRERMKKYSSSHRERRNDQNVETMITNNEDERWGNQLEQRMDSEICRTQEPLNFKSAAHSNFIQMRPKNSPKQDSVEELNSPFTLPRRSFCHAKQKSIGEESSLPNSPIFPTYMAATESAKAKARSMSTPKQRLGVLDTCAEDCNSPYKARLSPWSSFNEESNSTSGRRGNF